MSTFPTVAYVTPATPLPSSHQTLAAASMRSPPHPVGGLPRREQRRYSPQASLAVAVQTARRLQADGVSAVEWGAWAGGLGGPDDGLADGLPAADDALAAAAAAAVAANPHVILGSASGGRRRAATTASRRPTATSPVKVTAPSAAAVSRVEAAGAAATGAAPPPPPRRRSRPKDQKTVNTTARRRRRSAPPPSRRRSLPPSAVVAAPAVAAKAAPAVRTGAASPLPLRVSDDDEEPASAAASGSAWRKDALSVYLAEIRSHELLGRSEEIRLASEVADLASIESIKASLVATRGRTPTAPEWAAAAGMTVGELQGTLQRGVRAKNTLVSANMRLVASIVRKIHNSRGGRGASAHTNAAMSSLSEEDMIQEGCLGLIRAAELYDANRGFHFSTYATWWVRAVVQRALAVKGRMIHVPNGMLTLATKIRKTHSELAAASTTGDVTDEEVAVAVGITPAKLKFVNQVSGRFPSSLDAAVGGTSSESDESSTKLAEILEGDDNVEAKMVEAMQREELDRVLRETLRPQERAVVRLRFGLDDGQARTLTEIGTLLAVSKERVRQIVLASLTKLKTPGVREILYSCIGSA